MFQETGGMPREPYSTDMTDEAWVLIAPLSASSTHWWTPAHNRSSRRTECDFLPTAHRLPMATPAPRIPSLGHRVSLLPNLAEHGRLDRPSSSDLPASPKASRSKRVSIRRDHGWPVGKDHRARRRSWLRWAQARERPEAAHPGRYLGATDRQPSGTGQHIGSPRWCSLAGWPQPSIPEDTNRYR